MSVPSTWMENMTWIDVRRWQLSLSTVRLYSSLRVANPRNVWDSPDLELRRKITSLIALLNVVNSSACSRLINSATYPNKATNSETNANKLEFYSRSIYTDYVKVRMLNDANKTMEVRKKRMTFHYKQNEKLENNTEIEALRAVA